MLIIHFLQFNGVPNRDLPSEVLIDKADENISY